MKRRKFSRVLGVALSVVMLAGCFVPVPGFAEGQTDAGSAESQIQAAQADENAAESQLNNEKTAETAQAPAAASETAEADADATGDEEADASEESAATEGDESANESTIADAAAPVIRRVQGVSSLTGTAYAVFNSESGELDFVRSTESHSNGDTGTVTSISGGTYTGTIYTGFEDSAAVYNHQQAPWHGANVKKVDFVDKTIKKDNPSRLHARRKMQKVLYTVKEVPTDAAGKKKNTKTVDLTQKLFDEIAPKYADRNGGYTRIIKIGQRKGDAAMQVVLELV